MSSMRNAVQRRAHRERGQLPSRRRLGLLEKHKDYSLRAADYKKKQATLKSLRRKAADRNEDEFDFGMLSRAGPGSRLSQGKRWSGAVDGDRGNTALGVDVVRLLKTQDAGYLRTVRNVAAKEVRRLEERVVLAGGTAAEGDGVDANEHGKADTRTRKIVFMDAPEERDAALKDLGLHHEENEDEDLDDDDDDSDADGGSNEKETKTTTREHLERRLRNARARLKALTDAEDELEMQRARMAKTATVGGVTKNGKAFKVRERKR